MQPSPTPISITDQTTRIAQLLGRMLPQAPQLPAKILWTAIALARAHNLCAEATTIVDEIEARDGQSVKSLEERARIAFAAGEAAKALELLRLRAERSPSATATIAIARLQLETGEIAEARQLSSELTKTNPDLVTVQQLAADVARASGDLETARAYFLGLIDQRPEHPSSLLALAQISLDEGNRESAAAFFRRAVNDPQTLTPFQHGIAAEVATGLEDHATAATHAERSTTAAARRTEQVIEELEHALAEAPTPAPPLEKRTDLPPVPRPSTPPDPAPVPTRSFIRTIMTSGVEPDARVLHALHTVFGHEQLRPGQAEVIANALNDRDTLAIMPTGAGKSLTFQLPALLSEQTTVVISPLIALMKDQVDSLPPALRARTTLINSTLTPDEMRHELDRLARGELALAYIAPERLRNYGFLRALRESGVGRVVIDEAHCISMWGHDFRPDYLFIPRALDELGQPPVLAITATATPRMAEQIAAGLHRELDVVRASIFRPNLRYEVIHTDRKETKLDRIFERCNRERGHGIIYVSSRRDADGIAALLRDRGVNALSYHAGLDLATRARHQELFMTGKSRVMVATVAFGMGVDKADVRFIIHLVAPRSLEAYAQESGRAGRDGKPATCILLVSPSDRQQLMSNARRDEMDLAALRRVYAQLMQRAIGSWVITDIGDFRQLRNDPDDETNPMIAIGVLEQAGLVHRQPDAPRSYDLRELAASSDISVEPAMVAMWAQLEPHLPGTVKTRGHGHIVTAELAMTSGLPPSDIDRAFQANPRMSVREGQRLPCLELLPVRGDASSLLQGLLDRARADAETRIRQVMSYANDRRCRHATLAAHLGERLEPCGNACDICSGTATAPAHRGAARTTRVSISSSDVIGILEAVATLPFPMGKTGIVRLLTGSNESRVRADRSAAFGLLDAFPKGKVDTLIDRLIDEGWLARDLTHEFKLISITPKGKRATLNDFVDYGEAPKVASSPANGELDGGERMLYERLAEWRRAKSVEEAVPAYVVAPDSALKNLAISRPATKTALLSVPGFGNTRVEKYGNELLAVIGASARGK